MNNSFILNQCIDYFKSKKFINSSLIIRKFKLEFKDTIPICDFIEKQFPELWKEGRDKFYKENKIEIKKKEKTNDLKKHVKDKSVITKICSDSVSIAYLQKQLNLSYKETEKLFKSWLSSTPEKKQRKKFDEINKYVKERKNRKINNEYKEYIDSNGYKMIYKPGHPNQGNKSGIIREHAWVMSEHLGRPLKKGENIHHKNGIRHDNRIENLEIWDITHPAGQRIEDKVNWCKEFLESHGYSVKKI